MTLALITLAVLCLALIALHFWERYQATIREDAWRLERTALLQRIQAPERAVIEQAERPERKPTPVIPIDDDEAYAKAREALNGLPD